jgi:apolipoprotein N-acyltransferase
MSTHKPPVSDAGGRPVAAERPERPPAVAGQPATSGCLGLMLAGIAILFVVAGLVLLSSGLLANALLVGGAFFAYAFFHYVVWGWWLSARIRQGVEDEQAVAVPVNDE